MIDGYGLFKSKELSFYCYQDPKSIHNIIGRTSNGQKFSIYTLDDLNKMIHLRLNKQLDVKELDTKMKNNDVQHHV